MNPQPPTVRSSQLRQRPNRPPTDSFSATVVAAAAAAAAVGSETADGSALYLSAHTVAESFSAEN